MSVSVASGVGVGVDARDTPPPSVGHLSDSFRQGVDQSRVRDTPGSSYVHNVSAHDAHNVAPSVSSSFTPSSLLFLLSDSGFVSRPSPVALSSSSSVSLPLYSSSPGSSFSSLAPAPATTVPLFSLPSVVPSGLSLLLPLFRLLLLLLLLLLFLHFLLLLSLWLLFAPLRGFLLSLRLHLRLLLLLSLPLPSPLLCLPLLPSQLGALLLPVFLLSLLSLPRLLFPPLFLLPLRFRLQWVILRSFRLVF